MEKELYILRGAPGAGKSTVAESLAKGVSSVICEADNYLYNEYGDYVWSIEGVREAHRKCKELFIESVENEVDRIIISNTNVKTSEFKEYKEIAEENGYIVYILIIENRHGGVNSHDVPVDKLKTMRNTIRQNIKL